ncbi:hypothetical protein Y032_0777g2272 [Ancylostoma ceylanicum]|uniref:Uncharacterized protein n=1 Tax=Ancylostoma ceylanicum TaxID=53326 RepID=A0A016WCQ0_9BILA|nr:hypothetical protein Y032_0777g2272 [Ancylostoma ceylanicum]
MSHRINGPSSQTVQGEIDQGEKHPGGVDQRHTASSNIHGTCFGERRRNQGYSEHQEEDQQRHVNITSAKFSVDAAVSNLQEAFSKLDNRAQQEEQASQEKYLDHAWDLITTARAVLCKLAENEIEVSSTLESLEQAALRR